MCCASFMQYSYSNQVRVLISVGCVLWQGSMCFMFSKVCSVTGIWKKNVNIVNNFFPLKRDLKAVYSATIC